MRRRPSTIASAGETPYGFDFTSGGTLVVTEAFGGAKGKAAASSYALEPGRLSPVSASVADSRSEVCWAAVTKDGRFVYVTNFGDGTISSYAVAPDGASSSEAVAASTRLGEPGVRDEAITTTAASSTRSMPTRSRCTVGASTPTDAQRGRAADGLPSTVAGLAAS